MKFAHRLVCATLVNLWPLIVWRSSFSHVKNHRELVVGGRKKQTFDFLDIFEARFCLKIFDHFCKNFCKIKQYIKQKLRFFHVNQWEKSCLHKTFYIPHDFSIRPISVLGYFSSKWFFSDIMDKIGNGRKKLNFNI